MSPSELRAKLSRSQKLLRRQILAIYVAIAYGLIAVSIVIVALPDLLIRTGAVLFGVAAAHMLYLVVESRRIRTTARQAAAATEPSFAFYRADLERNLYLITGPQLWTRFFFMVPAAVLIFIGIRRWAPDVNPVAFYGVMAVCGVSLCAAVLGASRRARGYRREISEIDALLS